MSAAACFRCDWQGSTHARACPNCGAPLYRARSAAEAASDDVASEPDRRRMRSLPPGVSIGVALALALAVVFAIERVPERASTAPAAAPNRDRPNAGEPRGWGALVYLASSDDERPDLWVLDLDGGGAGPGPAVPAGTRELVDLSGAERGWIGIERAGQRDGRISAAVVRGMQAGADVVGLGHGDLVAWGPRGTSLVFARNGHADESECAPVRISLVTIASSEEAWVLDDPGFCGPVLSLSRSTAATYFTAASGDQLSVYLTGAVGVPHLMFDGLGALSAAPPAAFLLSPDAAERTLGERRGRAGTLLGWKGIGGPIEVGDGRNVLTVERILSWSADGARAALVGTLGERRGVFVLEAGSGTGPRVPRFVMPAGRILDAAFGPFGRLYLTTEGGILVDRGGSVDRVPVPADAPAPAGPIVWIS